MQDKAIMNILIWLMLGFLAACLLLLFAHKLNAESKIKLLGCSLVFAAIIYVSFALIWGDVKWFFIELLGVVVYTVFYILAVKRGIIWLGLGWLLHPLWDLQLHLYGPGHDIVPDWYAWACLSFDVVVFIYIMSQFFIQKNFKKSKGVA